MAASGGSGTTTAINVGPTSTSLCTANSRRRYLLITNNDLATTIHFAINTNNHATVPMHPIPAGGNYELGPSGLITSNLPSLPTGDIAAISESGTVQVTITEY